MSAHRARGSRVALAALAIAFWCGCGQDEPPPPPPPPPPPGQQPQQGAGTPAQASAPVRQVDAGADAAVESPATAPLPVRVFQESDFVETDQSRDPFRSFEGMFVTQAKGRVVQQRQVLVDRFALDELKLVGVVTRGAPSALFTDPTGLGWIVKIGDFLGKAELVHVGGPTGSDVAVNWRVDRIRAADIVFVREDPSHPEIPPVTRVIALYPVEEDRALGGRR